MIYTYVYMHIVYACVYIYIYIYIHIHTYVYIYIYSSTIAYYVWDSEELFRSGLNALHSALEAGGR